MAKQKTLIIRMSEWLYPLKHGDKSSLLRRGRLCCMGCERKKIGRLSDNALVGTPLPSFLMRCPKFYYQELANKDLPRSARRILGPCGVQSLELILCGINDNESATIGARQRAISDIYLKFANIRVKWIDNRTTQQKRADAKKRREYLRGKQGSDGQKVESCETR